MAIVTVTPKQWAKIFAPKLHLQVCEKEEGQCELQEEIPGWYLDAVKDSILAQFDMIGIELGDMIFKMKILEGVVEDIDVEAKHTVFRFTPAPMSCVEISIPWDSTSLRDMESFVKHYLSSKVEMRDG